MTREQKANKLRAQLTKFASESQTFSTNELRVILSLERIVARLEASPALTDHLIFKGGFVLLKVFQSERFTRDLDALCRGLEKDEARELIRKALETDLDDGFWFGDTSIQNLDEQGEYGALRFDCAYQIGDPPKEKSKLAKLSRIHFDLGFGDKVLGKLKLLKSPSILPHAEELSWKVYPLEFIYSEKLETLVSRADANSRSKDVYDMGLLYEQCDDEAKLVQAVKATFRTRETAIPDSFLQFTRDINTKQLKNSWASVQIPEVQLSFEESWQKLQKQFAKLDKAFAKY